MSNNSIFPSSMIFDKALSLEQIDILENQFKKLISISKERMDINQYQLYLDKNKNAYFPKGTLIHGTTSSLETLKKISETGILACEFLGKYEDGETFYCADFHRVPNDILVSIYDREFDPDGKTPFNKVNNRIGLIVNPTSKLGGLLYYDLFDSKFDNNYEVRNIINTEAVPRGFLDKNRGKASAILAGLPANAISGIVLGDKLVVEDYIKELENIFPNAYIITRNGFVIKDRTNTINIEDYEKLALESAQLQIKNAAVNRELSRLQSENKAKQEEFIKYMAAVRDVVSPFLQAKILLQFGYQSIPYKLLELLNEDEISELGINNKKTKK